MRDFTIQTYKSMISTLQKQGFSFLSFEDFMKKELKKCVILRHDVDLLPQNALKIAELEASMGIKASYHFRIVGESNDKECIKKIVTLGHEICYHYEDLNIVAKGFKTKGPRLIEEISKEMLSALALKSFNDNLSYFRQFYPVKVISMHGSPLSRYDNRSIWDFFNYRDSGIICEPYFDIDYSKILYLTETGRRWNGDKFNLRDKVDSGYNLTIKYPRNEKFNFSSSFSLMQSIIKNELPWQVIINTHPQRWTDEITPWLRELAWQNVKNIGKYLLVKIRGRNKKLLNA